MNRDINKRLVEYFKHKGLSQTQAAKILDYDSPEKISRLFRKDTAKPSYEIIFDLSNKFDDLNIDWLICGRGEMILTGENKLVANEDQAEYYSRKILDREIFNHLKDQIDKKDILISDLIGIIKTGKT